MNILNKHPLYLPGPQGGNFHPPSHDLPLQRPLAPRKLWLPSIKSSEHAQEGHSPTPTAASWRTIAAGAHRWLH